MAKLLKERARNPVVERSVAVGSRGHDGYRLDLHVHGNAHSYFVILTREEMLRAVSSWMEFEARQAAADEKKAVNASSTTETGG